METSSAREVFRNISAPVVPRTGHCMLGLLCVLAMEGTLAAQTPSWGQAQWGFPQVFPSSPATDVFEPVEVFPRNPTAPGSTVDPGQPPTNCPLLRPTGIRGFRYDAGTPLDPNDDR